MKTFDFKATSDFIKDAFQNSKTSSSTMTVEGFAKKVAIGASSLKMILSGKRSPTLSQVLSIARAMRLSPSEMSYLETLSLKENATNAWEKAYFAKALKQKKSELKLKTISTSKRDLIAKPFILPLLVYFLENKESDIDLHWLSKNLSVSEAEIKEAIQKFEQDDVLQKQNDGRFHIAFEKLSHRLVQRDYQKQVLADAGKRMDSQYDSPLATFVSYSFSADADALLRMRIELKDLMERYMAEENSAPESKAIAQASFQVYPVIEARIPSVREKILVKPQHQTV